MITEAKYRQYIKDFNDTCAGKGDGFGAFYDTYYEPDAVFEYVPKARRNSGRAQLLEFWGGVSEIMQETIRDHTHL